MEGSVFLYDVFGVDKYKFELIVLDNVWICVCDDSGGFLKEGML